MFDPFDMMEDGGGQLASEQEDEDATIWGLISSQGGSPIEGGREENQSMRSGTVPPSSGQGRHEHGDSTWMRASPTSAMSGGGLASLRQSAEEGRLSSRSASPRGSDADGSEDDDDEQTEEEDGHEKVLKGALQTQPDGAMAAGMFTRLTTGTEAVDAGEDEEDWVLRPYAREKKDEESKAQDERGSSASQKAEAAPSGMTREEEREAETFALQDQIRVFMQKKQNLSRRERRLRKEMVAVRREVRELELERASMGGMTAVQENDARIRKDQQIMEKRIMRAQEKTMEAEGANAKIRAEVNERRQEKQTLLKVIRTLERDIQRLQEKTSSQIDDIKQREERTREIEGQLAGVIEQSRQELQEMEQAWEELDQHAGGAKFDTRLPTPSDDGAIQQAKRELAREEQEAARPPKHVPRDIYDPTPSPQLRLPAAPGASSTGKGSRGGKRPSGNVQRTATTADRIRERWQQALMHAKVEAVAGRVNTLQELFQELQKVTGCQTVEEFVDRFTHANEKNYQLFLRVDTLSKEADDLRRQIMDIRGTIRSQALNSQVEVAEKREMLEHVDHALVETAEKKRRQGKQVRNLESILRAFLHGLPHLLEKLDMGHIAQEGRRANQLPGRLMATYFTALEYRVRQMLSVYMTSATRAGEVPEIGPVATRNRALAGLAGVGETGHETPPRRTAPSRRRSSIDKKAPSRPMSRSERRQSIDLSVMEIRRGMGSTDPHEKGGDAKGKRSMNQAVSSSSLIIGPGAWLSVLVFTVLDFRFDKLIMAYVIRGRSPFSKPPAPMKWYELFLRQMNLP